MGTDEKEPVKKPSIPLKKPNAPQPPKPPAKPEAPTEGHIKAKDEMPDLDEFNFMKW